MSPALNRHSVLEHFERGNAIEIRNGIMFDFYPGLLHVIWACTKLDQKVITTRCIQGQECYLQTMFLPRSITAVSEIPNRKKAENVH